MPPPPDFSARPRWLSPSGTTAAVLVGAAVAAGTGWPGLGVLLAFFVSSSLLTTGGGRRTAVQVLANGGIAALAALLALHEDTWRLAYVGALAAAAADTWSTEIGARSSRPPRLITTGRPVQPGTSGGVTWLGSAGGVGGALLVAGAALIFGVVPRHQVPWVAAAGLLGGVADSLLGATLQARYRCQVCGGLGEQRVHDCGGTGVFTSGIRWLTNDGVNLVATLTGAFVAWLPVALRAAALA